MQSIFHIYILRILALEKRLEEWRAQHETSAKDQISKPPVGSSREMKDIDVEFVLFKQEITKVTLRLYLYFLPLVCCRFIFIFKTNLILINDMREPYFI